ncbi:TetR/AcrR family transcriptional regulator [Mucilaginibacter sp. cycad4]|uniref:TetR/AcrR family transcriptional regulator n=1 Tax=Mucilaginibacter sp. cycad4 TaxID=3342096 RepID=UPI002AAAB977|nr:TetR/AcrR family transcriptional regulator [Mucilaginibacter gossypii]WPU99168.1 TetR/AcrR family transcriptional regulator [Mucilaginibacter gossypii]
MSKAQDTRMLILQRASELIYKQGYQATSIDEIIATTAVTKGALFYHFKNKEEMGLAIIHEIMHPGLIPYMSGSLDHPSGDIRKDLYEMMKDLLFKAPFVKVNYGCPAVNLIDEMAPLNVAFLAALKRIIQEWQDAIEAAIIKAQEEGELNKSNDPKAVATYITANYAGARNMGKMFGSGAYGLFLKGFKKFVYDLK